MKILQCSSYELQGERFNGFNAHHYFLKNGIKSKYCVWNKQSNDKETWQLFNIKGRDNLHDFITRLEHRLSIQSLLYPFSFQLLTKREFLEADIVHYHLIHNQFFSLLSLPLLTKIKPTIWTLHDPWAITGHCIYPYTCIKWKSGCGNCPNLTTNFKMKRDNTATMWKIKKNIYKYSNINIIVASKYMLRTVRESPLISKFNIHYIPFGIDLNIFKPTNSIIEKEKFGISKDSVVMCFRSSTSEFKGLHYIKEILHSLNTNIPICLLTFGEKLLLEEFKNKYKIIELGWVKDRRLLMSAYNTADFFLMPSTQEAFGMMAIEAMACGKPIITMDGTSLPEVIFAPDGGVSVPQGDVRSFKIVIEKFVNDSVFRNEVGKKALKIAKENYNFDNHIKSIINLYENIRKK